MSSTERQHSRKPVVGVPTCRHQIAGLDYDCTQHKYIAALYKNAGVLPLLIPLFGDALEVESVLDNVDGILLTGSHSNIHPRHYENTLEDPDFKLDEARDKSILPLIRPAVEKGLPLLAICRGFQELNVAYGGSLYKRLELEGKFIEHREDSSLPLDQRYGPAHGLQLRPAGRLQKILNADSIEVNSLHGQGIKTLGEGLSAEAHAEDGLIEAVSVINSPDFAIGVQWHPEWKAEQNPLSVKLFAAFGEACYAVMK